MSEEQYKTTTLDQGTPEPLSEERAIDRAIVDLLDRRRKLMAREGLLQAHRGTPLSNPSLENAQELLAEVLALARERGLDTTSVEVIFREVLADGSRAFDAAAHSAVARPEVAQAVVRIVRCRDVSDATVASALRSFTGIDGIVADQRIAEDALAVARQVSSGEAVLGAFRADLQQFEVLARLVEILLQHRLVLVFRKLCELNDSAGVGEIPAEIPGPELTELVLSRTRISPIAETQGWSSWLFLRVPEDHSTRSTDLLIRALLTARRYGLDTSHLHSLPGMSYEGFSYERDAAGLETRPHYASRGSRAFLLDAHRSPDPEALDRLVGDLLELGCFAHVLGCMPRERGLPGTMNENPITRLRSVLP